jgi:group II intron reverse transcriptase/maturase
MATETKTEIKETNKAKRKKKSALRHNEYYDMQDVYDKLYEDSKNDKIFKNLLEIVVDERNIELAYRNIKKNTGSKTTGVNGHTIADIAKWDTEKYVSYVQNRLRKYDPHKVRRVEIPKEDGTGRVRPIGIPTIEDRLIQQSIKQVLEPIAEAKFHPHSYGFRPNRSCENALARCSFLVNKSELHYAVDIDIKSFFDNVNHGKLIKQMWSMGIQDKRLISIISKMLKAEIKGIGIPDKGTPQGGILSPLLSNIVLNELDWWISDQWETFETTHKYTSWNKYAAIKKTDLKEVYIVRYADDFKILCRTEQQAQKMFAATKEWLAERLGLEISETKSKIVNLEKSSSEFLGFKLWAKFKGGGRRKPKAKKKKEWKKGKSKWVAYTEMTDKAKEKCKKILRKSIKDIKRNPKIETVCKHNSKVLGMQNYYKIACNASLDFRQIGYDVNRMMNNRLRQVSGKKIKGKRKVQYKLDETYKKFYKNNYKPRFVAGKALFPIADVQTRNPMCFTQEKCDYTPEGRLLIHDKLETINMSILHYLMENPVKNMTQEYNDNRISLYTGQQGFCKIMKIPLEIGKMEAHHIVPKGKPFSGTDEYSNLVFLNSDVHELIHATKIETVDKYIDSLNPDAKQLAQINKLRKKVGNLAINQKNYLLERRVRGNSYARCEAGEKPETPETVGLPIAIISSPSLVNLFAFFNDMKTDNTINRTIIIGK